MKDSSSSSSSSSSSLYWKPTGHWILAILPPPWVLGLLLAVTACLCAAFFSDSNTSSSSSSSTPMSPPATLSFYNVTVALTMLLTVVLFGLCHTMQLYDLSRQMMVAAAKCTVQLYLVGTFVLQYLLRASHSWMVVVWLLGVGLLASNEAMSRVPHPYPDMILHMGTSILSSIAIMLTIGVTVFHVLGDLTPWLLEPKTIIPVSGMLFGNAVSGVSLCASSFLKDVVMQQDGIQLRLARGATWSEAMSHIRAAAMTSALIPTINALSMTGVVSLPGMMTGQILAGQSATQAAYYQMIILVLIGTTSSMANLLLVHFMTHTLVDVSHHRLVASLLQYLSNNNNNNNNNSNSNNNNRRNNRSAPSRATSRVGGDGRGNSNGDSPTSTIMGQLLSQLIRFLLALVGVKLPEPPRGGGGGGAAGGGGSATASGGNDDDDEDEEAATAFVLLKKETKYTLRSLTTNDKLPAAVAATKPAVLQVCNLQIQRANLHHLSFSLYPGDRLGITGSSGVGKTQLLRTLAGLEDPQVSNSSNSSDDDGDGDDKNKSNRTTTTTTTTTTVSGSSSVLSLHGQSYEQFSWPAWRTQVSWMSQDRPSLDGTPRDFYDQVCQYRHQEQYQKQQLQQQEQQLQQQREPLLLSSSSSDAAAAADSTTATITDPLVADEETPLKQQQPPPPSSSSSSSSATSITAKSVVPYSSLSSTTTSTSITTSPILRRTPMQIAHEWNVPPSAFDRPWSTLSGGEAQRISLAIVLALAPQVLLLDEATSQLDESSKRLVEHTLQQEEGIPIILVSHSKEQIERFCTHHLELTRGGGGGGGESEEEDGNGSQGE